MTDIVKNIAYLFLLMLFLFSTTASATPNHHITDYHQTFFPRYDNQGNLRIVIRMYYLDNIPYYLTVNPNSFATETLPATYFTQNKIINHAPRYFTMKELQDTPYMKALIKYTSLSTKLQNDGITRAEKPVNGIFITADMCPSTKPFEKQFFNNLVDIAKKNHTSFPIALSITGLWIISHPDEFNWLVKQEQEGNLAITWMNHSFSHVYYTDLPLDQNFLLNDHTNITHEILATEKLLLEHGQSPSVFFRFPGLISNKKLMLILRQYSLIPIGADAWLAKDQKPTLGSFILIHGNSNEPQGIKIIMPLLQNDAYHWLSLDEAFN